MRDSADKPVPHVVIIGGGFGGLYCAMGLRRAPVRVTLIDRCNHHLFQPLLYQVATASLNPSDIAQPLRSILRTQRSTRVVMAEVRSVDVGRRAVVLTDRELAYDTVVVAAGATHSYFGHDDWAALAPGLKQIGDALDIRERFLMSFEAAEREPDPARRREILTFIVIGGGPTGVELAGAMAEVARRAMHREFRSIDPTTARIILIEGNGRLLPTFNPRLSQRARADLERMGVDVWCDARVTRIDAAGIEIGSERIVTSNVFWAAGVRASPLGRTLGAETDRAGRVLVGPDLTIPGHPEVFVIGDLAKLADSRTGQDVPGVSPAAMQMGRHVARIISAEARGGSPAGRPPFRYTDKGMLATIGRDKAVGTIFGMNLTGFPAWFMWSFVHVLYLVGFRSRVLVMIQWAWAYFRWERGARLITNTREASPTPENDPHAPRSARAADPGLR